MEKIEKALGEALGNSPSVEATKYSKKQLKDLSIGVLADHPKELAFYADQYGTFKNQKQFDAMPSEDQSKYTRFENDGTAILSAEERLQRENEELRAMQRRQQEQIDDLIAAGKASKEPKESKEPKAAKELKAAKEPKASKDSDETKK